MTSKKTWILIKICDTWCKSWSPSTSQTRFREVFARGHGLQTYFASGKLGDTTSALTQLISTNLHNKNHCLGTKNLANCTFGKGNSLTVQHGNFCIHVRFLGCTFHSFRNYQKQHTQLQRVLCTLWSIENAITLDGLSTMPTGYNDHFVVLDQTVRKFVGFSGR